MNNKGAKNLVQPETVLIGEMNLIKVKKPTVAS